MYIVYALYFICVPYLEINEFILWLIGWVIEWLIEWMNDWLIDWLIFWWIDWFFYWLINWHERNDPRVDVHFQALFLLRSAGSSHCCRQVCVSLLLAQSTSNHCVVVYFRFVWFKITVIVTAANKTAISLNRHRHNRRTFPPGDSWFENTNLVESRRNVSNPTGWFQRTLRII